MFIQNLRKLKYIAQEEELINDENLLFQIQEIAKINKSISKFSYFLDIGEEYSTKE